jgi:DNA-binding NtrC family response regulator
MDSTKCVLIVDDEPNVRLMLRTTLESVGYKVVEAEDGVRALECLRGEPCDLILLDLQMPKMDGMELLRRLRDDGNVVPAVILTAHGSIPEAVGAMKLGAIDFLTKPITPDALRRVVAEVIARHAVEPAQPISTHPEPVRPSPKPAGHSKQIAFDLVRAKRALNRGEFREAELLLREVVALDPKSTEAHLLLDRLLTLKEQEARAPFRILRNWFPSGGGRSHGKIK